MKAPASRTRLATWMMALVVLALTLPARGQHPSGTAPVTTEHDIVYTKVGDQELTLDLARPGEGEGPFPAVVVIHGGAWRRGDKASNRDLLDQFARAGYVAISPQYRFCPEHTFPAQIHDVKAAVRWLKAQADAYHVDPDRVGAMGFSAGGHLALMLGLTGPDDGLEGDGDLDDDAPDTRIHAVVNFFGPSDLNADDIPEVSQPLVQDFLGVAPSEDPQIAAQASPVTFASADDPPVLTFQGTKDPLVPHTQAYRLADALTNAGATTGRVDLILGAEHGWQGAELDRTIRETFTFFNQYLKPESP